MDERPSMVIFFNAIPDPRVERTRRHALADILLMVVIATICDQKGWDAIHEFFVDSDDHFETLLEFPSGVPSADTIRRVMGAINPAAFRNAFIAWANHLCQSTVGKLVASAARFGELIRSHWHIENKLHWVLDVTFGEDRARVSRKNGAENLALVRKMVVNLLKNAPTRKKGESLAMKRRRASWRIHHLLGVLRAGLLSDARIPQD